ncbi:fluoride efflux transporter CrcB [Streptomyces roseirectus]|uniref:Fluoride-specific ion channel FluC n=1 Tax=Streptomyces roseirectus TaxID=2768066 RepID=A0A7H0I7M1_9ACTN|nr:fluoride efflux transporter CrcB [Streptomyces roseirectus]QNP68787.1 fluoride efflux transporter CrcB [Streptomyces roseirectus]
MTAPTAQRTREGQVPVVAAVALGGTLGSLARYAAGLAWPARTGGFPWTTFAVNVVGCAVIGVLLVLVTEILTVHRLVRPFLGTGVLGGFTTFSTYTVDIRKLLGDGHPATAFAYLAGTLCAALAAVWLAANATRRLHGTYAGRSAEPGETGHEG